MVFDIMRLSVKIFSAITLSVAFLSFMGCNSSKKTEPLLRITENNVLVAADYALNSWGLIVFGFGGAASLLNHFDIYDNNQLVSTEFC